MNCNAVRQTQSDTNTARHKHRHKHSQTQTQPDTNTARHKHGQTQTQTQTQPDRVVPYHVSPYFQQVRAGTTVVLVLLRAQTLYVGWLGDSQAFLVRKDKPISLVEPHKPEREVRLN